MCIDAETLCEERPQICHCLVDHAIKLYIQKKQEGLGPQVYIVLLSCIQTWIFRIQPAKIIEWEKKKKKGA